MPARRASDATSPRYSGRCTSRPLLAGSGSITTAAIRPPSSANTASIAASSSNGTTTVVAATAFGTPAESAIACVASPEPALTSMPSAWPW